MNRYNILYFAVLSLVACTEDLGLSPSLTPRYLSVTPTSLTYTSASETKTISITGMETPWKMENGVEWVTLTPMAGSASLTAVSVRVTENPLGDEIRTGIFYLKADVDDWSYEEPISVTQSGAEPSISLPMTDLELTGAAGSTSVQVTSNCTWEVATPPVSWLTAEKQGDAILLSATTNETDSYRMTTFPVRHIGLTNISQWIVVRQAPASITASTETLVFNNTASSVNVKIESEADWWMGVSNSWIDVSPSSGTVGTSVITVSVAPNTSISERTGFVTIATGDIQRIQIPIRQRGIYIETEQSELAFNSNGGTLELSVLSNTQWTVSSVPEWIEASPSNGEGNYRINVTAQDNPNTTNRAGEIHISQEGLSIDATIAVTQTGKTFDVNQTRLNFGDKQETQMVHIETDGTWTVQTSEPWITASPSSASGSTELSVTVSENPDDSERIGQIVVSMNKQTATIDVVQKGKYFTVSNSLLNYTSKGGSIRVSITTNDTWTAMVEDHPTWIELSETSGSGNIEIEVTAKDNPSANSRTATVILETIHNQRVKIVVNQDARYLTANTREVLFYAKGGTSEAITISTDGEYQISCSDSWFSVTPSGDSFTVTASENTSEDRRTGYITIALTDLTEGAYSLNLSVTQLNPGGEFQRNEYGEDTDYDGKTGGELTIIGFGNDNNYDPTSTGITLSVSGFKSDTDWDSNE